MKIHRALPAALAACMISISGVAQAGPIITGISIVDKQDVLGVDAGSPPASASAINNFDGLVTLPDEHSTIVPDGSGGYTFYVASRTSANPVSTGLVVLSGNVNAATHQWTITLDPNNPPSQTFLSPVLHNTAVNNAAFDLNYAAPGSILPDPTNPGSTLMVYSATNRSIGLVPGSSTLANGPYNSVGIATSSDGGHTWPSYASVAAIPPNQNAASGPTTVNGATGNSVCAGYAGASCNVSGNSAYGRYPVVQPPVTISSLMSSTGTSGLSYTIGDGSPSGFIDTYSGSPTPYLYAVNDYVAPNPANPAGPELSQLSISQAPLNGGTAPLSFKQWRNGSFSLAGIGAASGPSAIGFLPGLETKFQSCEGPNQIQTAGSISFVSATDQYLLSFVCISRGGDPANGTGSAGAAWFFATNTDLTLEDNWSQPQEIGNSWAEFNPNIASCDSYKGWYPSLMSLNMPGGELGLDDYAFFLNGCRGDPTIGSGREFESAYLTIDTSAATAVPEPLTLSLFGAGVAGALTVRRRKKKVV
jgi:hypothetical protein